MCRKIYREIIITHTELAHSAGPVYHDGVKDWAFWEHSWILVHRLKVNYQKQRTGKESMKMIIQHFKLNILPIQNESGGHIWDRLLYIWTRNYFYLVKSWKRAKLKLLKTVDSNQSGKRNLHNIMDPKICILFIIWEIPADETEYFFVLDWSLQVISR